MTNFSLSEADRMVQRTAHEFAANEVRPVAQEYDERNEFAWDVASKAAEIGLTGVPLGGQAAEPGITAMITAEELSWGCAGIALGTQVSGLAATAISVIGSEEQCERFLPLCTAGDDGRLRLGALALTEPDAGSDAGAIQTRAVRDGDEYVINGTKRFITGGGIADLTVVFAREGDGAGWRDVSAFVVPNDAPGFSQLKVWDKMGIRASHTADLAFDEVRIPADHRLGIPDPEFRSGGKGALGTLAATRPWIGAFAVGLARAAFEYAADYARERKTFNTPLIEHQGVGFMLADMDIAIDAARLLTWRAGEMASSGQSFPLEEASKAKTFASDTAMKVTTDAVQVCGGVGFMREMPLEKWMRDAKIFQIFEGANQIQRMVIARNIQERHFV